mgnify:CR=1 FL=1
MEEKMKQVPLEFICRHDRTAEVCRAAVEEDGWQLENVPEEMKTPELCRKALETEALEAKEDEREAEVGAASAMAASAAVELFGGTPAQCLDAASFAIVNILGLVCDPIGGLVENPCQNRNAMGASNALISAELSMAGIKSITPIDETIGVMYAVGRSIPSELRETSMGGMAVAKSACEACAACAKETQK